MLNFQLQKKNASQIWGVGGRGRFLHGLQLKYCSAGCFLGKATERKSTLWPQRHSLMHFMLWSSCTKAGKELIHRQTHCHKYESAFHLYRNQRFWGFVFRIGRKSIILLFFFSFLNLDFVDSQCLQQWWVIKELWEQTHYWDQGAIMTFLGSCIRTMGIPGKE